MARVCVCGARTKKRRIKTRGGKRALNVDATSKDMEELEKIGKKQRKRGFGKRRKRRRA